MPIFPINVALRHPSDVGVLVDLPHGLADVRHGLRSTPAAFTLSLYADSQDDALKVAAGSFGRVVTTRDTEKDA
ncbi:MAG TPA: hypothetical protein VLZ05_20330 [Mycobacterium sp.]|nr:hypothetical protein [Mycobacterium sp.]HUH71011.1 hypothetical protein [Mycobacterium sp.]